MEFWRLRRLAAYEHTQIAHASKRDKETRLPFRSETDRIVRYEAHLTRQLYQAIHELEALQKQRGGEAAPLARVDVHGLPGA